MESGYYNAMQQAAVLQLLQEECLASIENTSLTVAEEGCPPVWDGILCWPPAAPASVLALPCPSYIVGFDPERLATRFCNEDAKWFFDGSTNSTRSNYTQCQVVPFPEVKLSSLIAQYIPLVTTVSKVGYSLSLITLIVAFSIFATFKKLRCPRNKLHMHLFVSFMMRAFTSLLKDALFVRGIGLASDVEIRDGRPYFLHDNMQHWQCKLMVSLWQYFIMANFSWILMEGIYLHNLLFLAVFSDASSITAYVILGWGLPLLFVVPWVVVRIMWEDTLCWTTNTNPTHFHLIKVPITVSVLINFVLFINIVRLLLSKVMAGITEEFRRSRYRRWAKSTLVLVPLFGVHYVVYLTVYYIGVDEDVEIVWLFIDQIFTSSQGFQVAVLYCLLNDEVRSELARQWWLWSLRRSALRRARARDTSAPAPLVAFRYRHRPPYRPRPNRRFGGSHMENPRPGCQFCQV